MSHDSLKVNKPTHLRLIKSSVDECGCAPVESEEKSEKNHRVRSQLAQKMNHFADDLDLYIDSILNL